MLIKVFNKHINSDAIESLEEYTTPERMFDPEHNMYHRYTSIGTKIILRSGQIVMIPKKTTMK